MRTFAMRTDLLPHQAAAANKVAPSRVGALFMDMGTGKTRTAIELVSRRWGKIDHVVYFCPVSLKETVRREILKHTDCTNTDICVFNDRTDEHDLPEAGWYIIGIESMSSSTRVVLAAKRLITSKTFVVLDESSYIKGHRSMRTVRVTELSKHARYRLILTGTPLSQGVVDLFAQMRFLSPKILGYGSFYSFAANHLEYSERYPGMIVRSHNTRYLAAKVQPYVYQVTKEECLDLPRKLYTTRYFGMTWEQRQHYEWAKDEIIADLKEDDIDSLVIFRLFSILQQITCGYWNRRVKKGEYERLEFEHERVDALLNAIQDIPAGKQIIIWTKYRYGLDAIVDVLTKQFGAENIAVYHGGLNERQRNEQENRFHNGARFFIGTPQCGGHGLTLNEAHYVIFYDNGFKYSERLQAEDRCHRIGQGNQVTYIDIQCTNSIDDRIANALAKKGDVVEDFRSEVDRVKDKKGGIRKLVKSL